VQERPDGEARVVQHGRWSSIVRAARGSRAITLRQRRIRAAQAPAAAAGTFAAGHPVPQADSAGRRGPA
jgi:hypothetical protein